MHRAVFVAAAARFVSAESLPDAPPEERRKITFRRLLLNKCQEEFEKGDAAMNVRGEQPPPPLSRGGGPAQGPEAGGAASGRRS